MKKISQTSLRKLCGTTARKLAHRSSVKEPEGYTQDLAIQLSEAHEGLSKVIEQRLQDIEAKVKQYANPKLEAMVQVSRGSLMLYSGEKDRIEAGARLIEQVKLIHPDSRHIDIIHDMLLLEKGELPLERIK